MHFGPLVLVHHPQQERDGIRRPAGMGIGRPEEEGRLEGLRFGRVECQEAGQVCRGGCGLPPRRTAWRPRSSKRGAHLPSGDLHPLLQCPRRSSGVRWAWSTRESEGTAFKRSSTGPSASVLYTAAGVAARCGRRRGLGLVLLQGGLGLGELLLEAFPLVGCHRPPPHGHRQPGPHGQQHEEEVGRRRGETLSGDGAFQLFRHRLHLGMERLQLVVGADDEGAGSHLPRGECPPAPCPSRP